MRLINHPITTFSSCRMALLGFLTGLERRQPVSPVLKSLHWLPIEQHLSFKIELFVFKSLNDLAPPYAFPLIIPCCHLGQQTSFTCLSQEPAVHLVEIELSLLVHPSCRMLCLFTSITTFKTHLKTHFFSLTFVSQFTFPDYFRDATTPVLLCLSVSLYCNLFYLYIHICIYCVLFLLFMY